MKLKILKVKGHSMHPTLKSGAFVLLWHAKNVTGRHTKIYSTLKKLPIVGEGIASMLLLKEGDIVAVHHHKYGHIIKRIAALNYANEQQYDSLQLPLIKLRGDNPNESVSELAMGWVGLNQVMGKVIWVLQ